MTVTPEGENVLSVQPESEVEAFYINRFLQHWQQGNATIKIKSGVRGAYPQIVAEIMAPIPANRSLPFLNNI